MFSQNIPEGQKPIRNKAIFTAIYTEQSINSAISLCCLCVASHELLTAGHLREHGRPGRVLN